MRVSSLCDINPIQDKPGEGSSTVKGRVSYFGEWIRGATVTVDKSSTLTGNDGKYELTGLRPGKHAVLVEPPAGYARTTRPVDLQAGRVTIVDFTIQRAVDIEVSVRGTGGEPIAGATVSGILTGLAVETQKTDDRGFVRFSDVPLGSYFLRASAEGYMGAVKDFQIEEGQEVANINFNLEKGACRLSGRVSEVGGTPVSAELNLLSSGVVIGTVATAKDGLYDFSGLNPGMYQITVTAPGHHSTDWFGYASDEKQVVDFILEPLKLIQIDPKFRYERVRGRTPAPWVWQRGISEPSKRNSEERSSRTE